MRTVILHSLVLPHTFQVNEARKNLFGQDQTAHTSLSEIGCNEMLAGVQTQMHATNLVAKERMALGLVIMYRSVTLLPLRVVPKAVVTYNIMIILTR